MRQPADPRAPPPREVGARGATVPCRGSPAEELQTRHMDGPGVPPTGHGLAPADRGVPVPGREERSASRLPPLTRPPTSKVLRARRSGAGLQPPPPRGLAVKVVTWLILPVVICLSQRLSHACLSISKIYSETANGSLNQLSFI